MKLEKHTHKMHCKLKIHIENQPIDDYTITIITPIFFFYT